MRSIRRRVRAPWCPRRSTKAPTRRCAMAVETYTPGRVNGDGRTPVDMPAPARNPKADETLGQLFSDLARETTTLIRQEMNLAKAEMTQKAAEAGKDVGMISVGGAVLYAGFLAILAAIIVGLGEAGLAWWASALIVGLIVAIVGGVMIWRALGALRNQDIKPTRTVQTLQADAQWAKDQVR